MTSATENRMRILRVLDAAKPNRVDLVKEFGDEADELVVELQYLLDHGLIDLKIGRYASDDVWLTPACITTKGRDYLDETGGLTAELNVVTVKLHEDTIRELLIARVRESSGDDSVKAKLVDQLKALPAQAVSKLAERALEQALRHMPDAIRWLQTAPWN